MKKCTKCEKEKAESEYNRQAIMSSGLEPACRDCRAKQRNEWASKNPAKRCEYQKRYQKKYPEKHNAVKAVQRAVKSGRLTKAEQCHDCSEDKPLVADHYKGYEKENRFNVQWICRQCDGRRRAKQMSSSSV